MMKVNTKDTFEKGFTRNALNSEKIHFDNKDFSFSRYSPLFKKVVEDSHFISPQVLIPYSDE